jgi:hypothetical protein
MSMDEQLSACRRSLWVHCYNYKKGGVRDRLTVTATNHCPPKFDHLLYALLILIAAPHAACLSRHCINIHRLNFRKFQLIQNPIFGGNDVDRYTLLYKTYHSFVIFYPLKLM